MAFEIAAPRTRGDDPDALVAQPVDFSCSPHTRG